MRTIVFYRNHMVETDGAGKVKIKRFMADQRDKIFTFHISLVTNDAIAWAKRWIERVVY